MQDEYEMFKVEVWDWNVFSDQFMGYAMMNVEELLHFPSVPMKKDEWQKKVFALQARAGKKNERVSGTITVLFAYSNDESKVRYRSV